MINYKSIGKTILQEIEIMDYNHFTNKHIDILQNSEEKKLPETIEPDYPSIQEVKELFHDGYLEGDCIPTQKGSCYKNLKITSKGKNHLQKCELKLSQIKSCFLENFPRNPEDERLVRRKCFICGNHCSRRKE